MPASKLKDIADALGLSHSTVSRALKGDYRISEETKKRVQEFATQIKYKPNLAAQSLRNNRTRSIGILVPNISNNFFGEVLNGIESVGYEKNYHVIISQTRESSEDELTHIEDLISRSVDGLLISLSSTTKNVDLLKKTHEAGTPIVFFDRVPDDSNTHKVVVDNSEGAYNLTKHLLENGYRTIAHITSAPAMSITSERLQGYKKALTEFGIPFQENLVKYCLHGGMLKEEVETALEELLKQKKHPDALTTASDRITISSLALLHEKKISIPGKIAVGGFSNFSAPEIINPSLTTIRQPAFEMGRAAAELLIKLVESKKPVTEFQKIVLPTEVVIRESSVKNKKK